LPTSIPKPRVFCEKPRIQRLNEFEMITQDSSFVNDQIKEMIYFLEQKHEDYTAYVLNLNPSEQNKIKMFVSKQTGQCYIFCDSVEKNDTIVFFHQIEEKLKNCDPTHIFECSEPKITFIMPAFKNPQEQEK
jgi:dihydroorotate dehydrogenase